MGYAWLYLQKLRPQTAVVDARLCQVEYPALGTAQCVPAGTSSPQAAGDPGLVVLYPIGAPLDSEIDTARSGRCIAC